MEINEIIIIIIFSELWVRNTIIKEVERNAEKSLRIYINITKKQRMAKLDDKMAKTTDSSGSLKLSMVKPAMPLHFQTPILLEMATLCSNKMGLIIQPPVT